MRLFPLNLEDSDHGLGNWTTFILAGNGCEYVYACLWFMNPGTLLRDLPSTLHASILAHSTRFYSQVFPPISKTSALSYPFASGALVYGVEALGRLLVFKITKISSPNKPQPHQLPTSWETSTLKQGRSHPLQVPPPRAQLNHQAAQKSASSARCAPHPLSAHRATQVCPHAHLAGYRHPVPAPPRGVRSQLAQSPTLLKRPQHLLLHRHHKPQ
ncbi:hypothetical protein BKA70DRAFT_1476954 [Coprinopsis sp. MPI-PUGE-AT-0042]|nr:hypothetical protein BKA70DRAFT_1476954 [Coprinopsis sp. MPI-PUGE-AT-0042]